jgi:hypothetical protein
MKNQNRKTEAEQNLEDVELQPVPIERTLAKYLNIIFAPARATKQKPRVKTWQVLDPTNKEHLRAQLAILDTFNPTDARVLLALFVLYWQIPANQDGTREFSLQQLAQGRLAWNGGHGGDSTPRRLKDILLRLRFNGLLLSNIYRNPQTGGFIRDIDTFTILDKLRVVERVPLDKSTGLPQEQYADLKSRFRFHKTITTALENREIKPMFVKHLLNIDPRAEAALLTALFLDAIMADKTAWQRRAQALISEDLQLTGNYPAPSHRKKVLDRIVNNLQGFPISTGILHLSIEHTNDKTDYKLIVSKSALPLLLVRRQTLETPQRHQVPADRQNPLKTQFRARTGHPYNLTEEQEQKAEALAAYILETIGQPKNRSAYFKLAAQAIAGRYEQSLHRCLGLTKEAIREHRIKATPSQYLHKLIEIEKRQLDLMPASPPVNRNRAATLSERASG